MEDLFKKDQRGHQALAARMNNARPPSSREIQERNRALATEYINLHNQLIQQRHASAMASPAPRVPTPTMPSNGYYQPVAMNSPPVSWPQQAINQGAWNQAVPSPYPAAMEREREICDEAKFDSGIGSMPDDVSKSKEQDDDKRSIRSILTNASRVLLPPQEEKHLIAAFAGDLCQDIVFRGDLDACDRISTRLSDLLKNFTLRLEESVNLKTERDAKEFIRQQRK
jgi:hypothetical protein